MSKTLVEQKCPYCGKVHKVEFLWTTNERRRTFQEKLQLNNYRCGETMGCFKKWDVATYPNLK